MKRLLTSAAMFLCSLMTFAQSSFTGSGSGTENDPYLILNPIQLNQMRNYLNINGVYFKLMANIDLEEFIEDEYPQSGWMPVGNSSSKFKGTFDGNGNIISGLTINRENTDFVGLFGDTDRATIKNLTIKAKVKGRNNVGIIAGNAQYTTISNCFVEGNVVGATGVGGIVGYATNGTISDCYSTANISGTGDYIGGISGRDGSVINCVANNITVSGHDYIGGVIGFGAVINSVFEGVVKGNSIVGGLSGLGCASFSCAIGDVIATGDQIGGLIGCYLSINDLNKNIINNYFSGTVSGNNQVGGLVGYYKSDRKDSYIYYNYASASIIGHMQVGGLCGFIEGYFYTNALGGGRYDTTIFYADLKHNIANNKSIKAIEGEVGRIYGKCGIRSRIGTPGTSDENKSYNKTIIIKAGVAQEVSDDEQNGSGVSSTTLKLKATYVAMGWDFTDTWEIQETECYPYFKTQTAPPIITSNVVSGATAISGKCVSGAMIILEIDDVRQQMVSNGNIFSFTVDPLQAGHDVRVHAKAEGKKQSYYAIQTVAYLGNGTETDPYQVYTAADLTGVDRKGYFKLMNDIDLTSYINQFSPTEGWESIGREGSETINFDGNGYKITGLWCNSTRDNTGLFSCFANGCIKNLTVVTANGKQVKGGANTGILIGKLINGTITNCKVTGTVADGTPVGGMIGKLDGGKLSGCQADVTINVTGENSYVGGLAGEVTGDVEQSLSYGTLTATGNNSYVGGLVGLCNDGSSISNSYSSAVINSSLSAAGIVAYNFGVVDKCYADGNIFSMNYGAGIVGYNDGEGAVVKNCVAMNNKIDVTFESQSEQSGGYGMRIIGGIKNNAPAPEMNNYALKTMQVSVNDVPQKVYDDIMNGTAKTLAQLKSKATYEELGWDFNTIWRIEEGSTYPYQVEASIVDDPDNPDNPDNPDEQETIAVTDISSLTDAIYAEAASAQSGSEGTLTIRLKNAQVATAYSFDLQLPTGVSMVEDQYTLSNRHNGHGETVNYQAETGVYSFAVLSLQTKQISGNEGAIWTLKLKVADNVANGSYAIKITNAKYSLTSGSSKVNLPETTSKLTISQYKKGDANNDGDVDIADAVCIINHVVGLPTPSFVKQAADANSDGDVDIADAVRIVNLVVGKINALSRGNSSRSRAATRAGETTDAILIDATSVFIGKEGTLTVSLKNSQKTNAYSFDMVLPEGVSIVQDDDDEYVYELSDRHNGHMSTLNYIGNNTYSFAILSLQSKEVSGNDGAICRFKVKADDTAVSGKHAVTIQNAKYSLTSGETKVTLPEATGQLAIKELGDVNGDGDVTEDDVDAVANHIIGQTPTDFDLDAADVNGDKTINAADIVKIVNIIKLQK